MSHDDPQQQGHSDGGTGRGDDSTGPVNGPDHTAPIPSPGGGRPEGSPQPPSPGRQPQGPGPEGQQPQGPGPQRPMGGPQQPSAGHPQAGGPQQAPMYGGWHQPGPQQHGPAGAPQPGGPQPPYAAYGTTSTPAPPRRRSRRAPWVAVPLAAVLAAVLASGGTYALTQGSNDTASPSGTSTTVVKTDPADFGNAGQVNWAATAAKVKPSVVSITVIKGQQGDQGSGVILDTDGNIVTNNHVISLVGKGGTVRVTLSDHQMYEATVVGTDPSTDLAVVRLKNPPSNLKPIKLGNDHKLLVGQPVMAIGNPLGLSSTVTTGIVSALNRPVTTQADSGSGGDDGNSPFDIPGQQSSQIDVTTNAIQTSAAINPGNSGGALVTGSGKLIGINSSIATVGQSSANSQSGNIGIGFAIPVSVVKNITKQLIDNGSAVHAQVGVSVRTASVKEGDSTEVAAKVVKVNPGSPAEKAGLKSGDVITAIDGQPVVSADSLVGYVRAKTVGEKIKLTVVRDGQQKNVTVTLGADTSGN